MSRVTQAWMLKLEMCTRKTCQYAKESVTKRLFDSVLAKNQIFLNETDGRRLEIKLQGK